MGKGPKLKYLMEQGGEIYGSTMDSAIQDAISTSIFQIGKAARTSEKDESKSAQEQGQTKTPHLTPN